MKGAQKQIAVRLSEPLIERLDTLVEELSADPHYALSGPWNRSAVLRETVIRGIAALEKELRKGR
jgi:predicted DNA-binding protein